MITIRTSLMSDGTVDLIDWHYLLDDNEDTMLFKSVGDAKQFLTDNGGNPEDPYIEFVEENNSER